MARMRPSSTVNINERKIAMGLSHTAPTYGIKKELKMSNNGPNIGIGMHQIILFPYKIGCGAAAKGAYSCKTHCLYLVKLAIRSQHMNQESKKSENGPEIGIGMRKIVLFPYKIGCGAALKGPYSCWKPGNPE